MDNSTLPQNIANSPGRKYYPLPPPPHLYRALGNGGAIANGNCRKFHVNIIIIIRRLRLLSVVRPTFVCRRDNEQMPVRMCVATLIRKQHTEATDQKEFRTTNIGARPLMSERVAVRISALYNVCLWQRETTRRAPSEGHLDMNCNCREGIGGQVERVTTTL